MNYQKELKCLVLLNADNTIGYSHTLTNVELIYRIKGMSIKMLYFLLGMMIKIFIIVGFLLLIPIIAIQLTDEVN